MTDQTLTVDGIDVQVVQLGAGPTLLWLHGYASHPGEDEFLERLATGYRVVAPVHPGFGEVSRIPWVRSMEDLAFYYRHVIETLGGGHVTLAGHSVGGWIASEFAVRFSHLLRGLVLIAPFGLRHDGNPPADIFMLDDVQRRERAWHDISRAPATSGPPSLPAIRDLEMTAQLGWEPRLFDPRLAERLRWIDVPTLIVWGEQDRIVPAAYAQEWTKLVREADKVIIPDAGHYVHVERPEACAAAIAGSAAGLRTDDHAADHADDHADAAGRR
ncbi:MAG: alpha/beta fold hydrolase [Micromonosporaceae bacterium]